MLVNFPFHHLVSILHLPIITSLPLHYYLSLFSITTLSISTYPITTSVSLSITASSQYLSSSKLIRLMSILNELRRVKKREKLRGKRPRKLPSLHRQNQLSVLLYAHPYVCIYLPCICMHVYTCRPCILVVCSIRIGYLERSMHVQYVHTWT